MKYVPNTLFNNSTIVPLENLPKQIVHFNNDFNNDFDNDSKRC